MDRPAFPKARRTSRDGDGIKVECSQNFIRVCGDDYKERVKGFWNGRSEAYDVNNNFHPPLCAYLVNLAQPFPGSVLLDIATGTGSVAFAAVDAVGPSGRVVGLDITETMLEQVRLLALVG